MNSTRAITAKIKVAFVIRRQYMMARAHFNTNLRIMTCALFEGHRVEAEVSYFVEPTRDLPAEVRGGSGVCPGGPCDCNVLADRESG
jgi:hypothetical protein